MSTADENAMAHTPITSPVDCPYCGGNAFIFGPRGGLSVNVCCVACRHWINVDPLGHIEDIDRVEPEDSPIFKVRWVRI